jgi:hypothetical protein
MTSDKQIEANRLNALQSTGPRTDEGKALSSQNAIRHGLLARQVVIAGESEEEFGSFQERLLASLEPVGELELMLADRIVSNFWRLARAGRIEVELFDVVKKDAETICMLSDEPMTVGKSVSIDFSMSNSLSKLRRYESHIERSLFRSLHELQRVQAVRKGKDVAAPAAIDVDVSGMGEA